MDVDGQLLDNDFPFGSPAWTEKNTWNLDAEFVSKAELFLPVIKPTEELAKTRATAPVQYWMPHGHNNWVGDVATFFHQGRYHLFYLFDRRHHESKFGRGAHYFEHISTPDFKTWTEHEARDTAGGTMGMDRHWHPVCFQQQILHRLRPAHDTRFSGIKNVAAHAAGLFKEEWSHGGL